MATLIYSPPLILILIFSVILAAIIYVVSKTDKTISRVDIVSNDGLVYITKQGLINNISKVPKGSIIVVDGLDRNEILKELKLKLSAELR